MLPFCTQIANHSISTGRRNGTFRHLAYPSRRSIRARPTMTVIPYKMFSWNPPELSAPQRIELGQAIAAVGRDAFLKAYKIRLMGPNRAPFTFSDVLRDAAAPTPAASPQQKLFAGALLTALGAGAIGAPILIPLAFVMPVSGGSLWWMNRKIERWAQTLVDRIRL
jgi:hypothetical protein